MENKQFEMLMSEIKGLKTEMKSEFAAVRKEIDEKIGSAISELRKEMSDEFANVRKETDRKITSLRTEMNEGFGALKDRQILMTGQMTKMMENQTRMQRLLDKMDKKLEQKADKQSIEEQNEITQNSINTLYALSRVNEMQHKEYDRILKLQHV